MSYHTWHNYGIGINVDKIETTVCKIKSLISLAPEYTQKFSKYVDDWKNISVEEITDIASDMDCGYYGLAPILQNVISEKENIIMLSCNDFDGNNFLIFEPVYPWEITDNEKTLTEESLKALFEKYIKILTDQSLEDLDYDRQQVENGG